MKLEIEFAGIPYEVSDEPTTVSSTTGVVPVDDYAKYGIGLYKIVATSTGRGLHLRGHRTGRRAGQPARDGRGGDRDRHGDRGRSRRLLVRAPRRSSGPRDAALDVPRGHPRRRHRASCSSSTGSSTRRRSRRSSSWSAARRSAFSPESSAPAATSPAEVRLGLTPRTMGRGRVANSAATARRRVQTDHPAPSADEDTTITRD